MNGRGMVEGARVFARSERDRVFLKSILGILAGTSVYWYVQSCRSILTFLELRTMRTFSERA